MQSVRRIVELPRIDRSALSCALEGKRTARESLREGSGDTGFVPPADD